MSSFFDKIKLSGADVIKIFIPVIAVISGYYTHEIRDERRYVELMSEIKEIKTYKNADEKVIESRFISLETNVEKNNNRTNEIEKNVIRLMAILPNNKIKIENDDNN